MRYLSLKGCLGFYPSPLIGLLCPLGTDLSLSVIFNLLINKGFNMNIEIPDFLIEMSKQLHEQDNRITAEPIFEVRCKRYLVTEEGYNESHWELLHPEDEGRPIYSTKDGFDWSESKFEFYEGNEDWCNEWLKDRGLMCNEIEFKDHFDFVEHKEQVFEDWPDGYYVIHLQEAEETIKSCLTEADAKAFIARKQHDYPKLYTYANSMVFCPQMIELRNWIMSLTEA